MKIQEPCRLSDFPCILVRGWNRVYDREKFVKMQISLGKRRPFQKAIARDSALDWYVASHKTFTFVETRSKLSNASD